MHTSLASVHDARAPSQRRRPPQRPLLSLGQAPRGQAPRWTPRLFRGVTVGLARRRSRRRFGNRHSDACGQGDRRGHGIDRVRFHGGRLRRHRSARCRCVGTGGADVHARRTVALDGQRRRDRGRQTHKGPVCLHRLRADTRQWFGRRVYLFTCTDESTVYSVWFNSVLDTVTPERPLNRSECPLDADVHKAVVYVATRT